MHQERKEFRKSFYSYGEIYVAGERLHFMSYDVSLKGILIQVELGTFLAGFSDFEALITENDHAEIFVKDLMLTGEASIAWVKRENDKVLMGLEYRDVMYNAEKLWRKRKFYRSRQPFSGYLISTDDSNVEFEGVNQSVDGLCLRLKTKEFNIQKGFIVKFYINDKNLKGLGQVVWIKKISGKMSEFALRHFILK